MFDIGFFELLLIATVGLLVIGPARLPETIRAVGLWVGRAKRALNRAYKELDRELGLDDVRRQLHNEEVMRNLEEHKRRLEAEILGKSAEKESDDAQQQLASSEGGDGQPRGDTPTEPPSDPASQPATQTASNATRPATDAATVQSGQADQQEEAPARKDGRHE